MSAGNRPNFLSQTSNSTSNDINVGGYIKQSEIIIELLKTMKKINF